MTEEELRRQLVELKIEHDDLDAAIRALASQPVHDTLQLQRLKRKKLALKDAIACIHDRLTPDIIA